MSAVTITYCRPCGYEKRARVAAEALQASLGVEPTLIAGSGGIFEVKVNDAVVCRRTREYFPDASDVVAAVAPALAKR